MSKLAPDDRHSLQHLACRGLDAGDHVRVERLHPLGLRGGAPGELVHRERHAAAQRGDLRDLLAVGPGEPSLDQLRHAVVIERLQLDHGRRVAVDQAVASLDQRGAHRRRPVAEHDADVL